MQLEAEKLDPYNLLVDFISSLNKDGYIADEICKVLLEAVESISKKAEPTNENSSRPRENDSSIPQKKDILGLQKEDMSTHVSSRKHKPCQMSHAHGYIDLKVHTGHLEFWKSKGEAIRGDPEDQSFADPKVTKMLQAGVDCEAILRDRAFNCRTRGNLQEDACIITSGFMQPFNYLGHFRMSGEKLNTWLNLIGQQYSTDVPYHNWLHAFDVFQLSFLVLTDGGMSEYLNLQDRCAIMIAAVAHDVGHEGKNNSFQTKGQTELAIMYNDKSPLENMHSSLTFETLQSPGANFLELFAFDDFANVRAKIIEAILATDPTHHFPFVEKLSARLGKGPIRKYSEVLQNDEWKSANKSDRTLLLQGFVHLWDVGNGFRPWDTYKEMVASLEEEFFAQGDAEREEGLPITALMDRSKDRLVAGQDFFLGKLVLPLYDLYANFMKQDLADLFRSTLESNKHRWKELIEKHGLKPASEILALEALEPNQTAEHSTPEELQPAGFALKLESETATLRPDQSTKSGNDLGPETLQSAEVAVTQPVENAVHFVRNVSASSRSSASRPSQFARRLTNVAVLPDFTAEEPSFSESESDESEQE